ncbi:glycoside hydrolase family 3 protein [Nonomuraea roseola]|uniref:Glycoside hydrolase family 3 C-terminal domain-containing protein n=1 Tax=Nonomuraea roseola TaxID=46179 RepID=A0ABV5Q6Q5_9ACTN
MKRALLALALVVSISAFTTDAPVYQDPSRPLAERVEDLLGRLTPDEKISLLHQSQEAIPRLGLPYHKNGTEALHGVGWSNDHGDGWKQKFASGTIFPQAVGLASTWNPELIKRVGAATGDEVRGYAAENPELWGTQVWAPVVNLLRDPRWGRNEEGYSEDPLLTGAISTAYGKGLSGDDPVYLKTAPVLKHYLANNNEYQRSLTSSNLPPRVKHEYDEAAFKPAISADAATGVMGSYNLVNGRPNTVNPDQDEVVRTWTDKVLYNVSDAWAPQALYQVENYHPDEPTSYAATLKAGQDSFTVDGMDTAPMTASVKAALERGLITQADIDTAVRHVLSIRIRLGHADPGGGPYAKITKEVVDSPAHRALNRRTAAEAMVLLRNDGRLPLDQNRTRSVAVVGPLQDKLHRDWYGGALPYQVTPKRALAERAQVTGLDALDRVALRHTATGRYVTASADLTQAVTVGADRTAAAQWDLTDWTGGVSTLRNAASGKLLTGNWGTFLANSDEPDGWFVQQQFRFEKQGDGSYLIQYVGYEVNEGWWSIPEHYLTVRADGTLAMGAKADAARFAMEVVSDGVKQAVEAAKGADAAVVVVGSHPFVAGREIHDRADLTLGASQLRLIEAVQRANPNTVVVLETGYPVTVTAKALLWTTHAGPETGHAVADAIFGEVNPAGRLTQTWYPSSDLPDILDYDITKTGMTYLYHRGDPLYAFGHGLSYTTFGYQGLKVTRDGQVSVRVTNTGSRAGDEVVQLYTHQQRSRVVQPVKQLRGFQRLSLRPGESREVRFTLKKEDLALWDVTRGRWTVESATHDVLVGGSSSAIRQRATLQVAGERIPPRELSKPTRAIDFDDYKGVRLVDLSKERGEAVGGSAGDWLAFKDSRLGSAFTAQLASVTGGSVEVRLGSPTGRLLGTLEAPATGDVYTYATAMTPITPVRGVHDVYLVFTGDVRVGTFTLA